MARKVRVRSDDEDDAPEVISHSTSRADAKRSQRALRDFEAGEKARRKARNQEKDQKLKERAQATKKGGKTSESPRGVRFLEDESGMDADEGDDDVEARMLRAMRDAADEVGSEDGEADGDGDDGGEFTGFGEGKDLGDDMASGSDSSSLQDEDDQGAGIPLGEGDSIDPEALTDDEEMDEEEDEAAPLQKPSTNRSKAGYLPDDLFAAAFASQNSKLVPKQKNAETTPQQTIKKRRRKSTAHPKDLVIGGRTIRTLPRLSDPRSQATARSVPSARARKFLDHSLAMKGKQALLKAKKRGWERRPANVGVMKYQGAPHRFARSPR